MQGFGKMSKLMQSSLQMKDKFRGCLVGALLGDCLGAPFEGQSLGPIPRKEIESVIGLKSESLASAKAGSYEFTGTLPFFLHATDALKVLSFFLSRSYVHCLK